jgi:23S rRNA (cytidine2498-2'-O)-methyltransferase
MKHANKAKRPASARNAKPGAAGRNAKPGTTGRNAKPGTTGRNAKPGTTGRNAKPGAAGRNAKPGARDAKSGAPTRNAKPGARRGARAASGASGPRHETRATAQPGRARPVRTKGRDQVGDTHEPARTARPQRSAPVARVPHTPEIVKPAPLSRLSSEPHPGMWLFTTREGSEQDLVDELLLAKVIDPAPRVLAPALVLSPKLPRREGRHMELTFARQGFEIVQSVKSHDLDEVTQRVARSLKNQLTQASQYALHVWVPDSTEGNTLTSLADELDARIERALSAALPQAQRIDDASLRRLATVPLAQVAVIDTQRFAAGVMHGNRAPSLAKGGRTRVRVRGDLPSRAARKIEEALAWIGVAPGPGEVCADLGAAPGGWTYVLAERRARVIAVDPAKLRPDILAKKGVRHVQESAFTFTPDEPIDWLFCDMAWRPLEAAALLAKWGRKRWARILVANIKLPMTKKAEILARVRLILEHEGEWKHVRAKQLYHDRDEITLTAVRA